MREPSASQGQLAEHCGHPFASYVSWPQETPVHGNDFGKVVHAGAEACVRGEDTALAAMGLTEDEAARASRCVDRIREFLATESYEWARAEVILVYHVESGVTREKRSRFEPRERGERTVIIDMAAQYAPGRGLIRDWKTGRQQYLKEAEQSWQLGLGAIAAAAYFNWHEVRVEYAYVDENDITIDGADLDAWELEEWAERHRKQRVRLTQGPLPPTPGPWCTQLYCPLRGTCAATREALATVAPHPVIDRLHQVALAPLESEEQAARVYTLIRRAKAVVDAQKFVIDEREKELKVWAGRGGIRLGNGKRVVLKEHGRRDVRIETQEQVEALREVLGDATDVAVQERRVFDASVGSVAAAARKAAEGMKRGAKGAIESAAMQALEAAGAVKKGSYLKLDEIDDKETSE